MVRINSKRKYHRGQFAGQRRVVQACLLFLGVFLMFCGCPHKSPKPFTNSLGMRMVYIEPGQFVMVDTTGLGEWDERPAHRVTLTSPFWISETEVTIQEFQQFDPSYQGIPRYAPYAAGISWHEAIAFCHWLNKHEERSYRLPSKAEWERRPGGTSVWAVNSGNDIS